MAVVLSAGQVWQAIEKEVFAVLGMVSAHDEARTVGVVYTVNGRKLYIATGKDTWKARHIAANPNVSLTIPIAKRIPFMPWMKIPAATVTFSGSACLLTPVETPAGVLQALFRGMVEDKERLAGMVVIEVTPEKDFVTYGVGVPLMTMRDPAKSRGRVAVSGA